MRVYLFLHALPDATLFRAMNISDFREATRDTMSGPADWPHALSDFLAHTHGAKGRSLVQEAGNRLQRAVEFGAEELLRVDGALWWYLHARFQRFYSGEAMREHDAPLLHDGTVIPAERVSGT